MTTGITPLLMGIEKLKQEARAVNQSANTGMEKMFRTDQVTPPKVADDELLKLSKLANITFKLMKDLDVAEENILNNFKLGD